MQNESRGSATGLPGFRHVLEAALFFGAVGGLADVSYIFTRSPDLVADILGGLRFLNGGVVITALGLFPWILIVFVVIRPLAAARRWPLDLSLGILYALALLPAALIVGRSFALILAQESILVAQVKAFYYLLKYLWVLLPVCWAVGLWLARLRTRAEYLSLFGWLSAFALSAALFLMATPYWQQRLLLMRANVYSELTSTRENMIITAIVFVAALILLPIAGLVATRLAKVGRGRLLAAIWLVGLAIPFVPRLFARDELIGSRPSGAELSGRSANVVLVSLDTVRYDDVGFDGSEIVSTPALDELAESSVVFDEAITPMPMTGPAHISMLTGLQPDPEWGHGVKSNGVPLADDVPTLATILDEAGYETGAIIGGFPLARRASGTDRGFHYYHDIFNTGFRGRFLPDQVWYLTVAKILKRVFKIREGLPHGRTKTADDVTDQAIDWLDRSADKPFFLFVHYFDPHYLYAPPQPFDTMYMPAYDGVYKGQSFTIADLLRRTDTFTQDDFDYFRALYRGEISFVDQEFRRLLDWGDEKDLWDNTLLIVVSDHGESFEHDYYFTHTDRVYEQLVHVPMMIRDPDALAQGIAGRRIGTLINVSDIYFTVLSFLGIESPRDAASMHEQILGARPGWDHDLLRLIQHIDEADPDSTGREERAGETVGGWDFVASQSYTFTAPGEHSVGRFFTFRFPDWQLIYGPDSAPVIPMYQYFDVIADPEERIDIFPEIVWREHDWPSAPEVLAAWASRQGAADLSTLDPRMREELKALGYIGN